MPKVTVYGGTNNRDYSDRDKQQSAKLGVYLAGKGATVLTGGCWGFPHFVGLSAVNAGATVIGYSPALNEREHIEKYGYPIDGVTKMEYIPADGLHKADNFIKRSWDMSPFSDVVVALGGSWGTYLEILFSFIYKKTIILVEEFEGAAQAFSQTHAFFGSRDYNPDVHYGATIIKVATIDDAITTLEKLL